MPNKHINSKISIIFSSYELTNQSTIACKPFSIIAHNTLNVTYPTTIVHAIATASNSKAKAHKVNSCGAILNSY